MPDEWEHTLVAGMRVIVPFRGRRFYTGIVLLLHQQAPDVAVVKEITALLDEQPVCVRAIAVFSNGFRRITVPFWAMCTKQRCQLV